MMDELQHLEFISLVSKVASELQNHVGVSDKTLAEFLIAKRLECSAFEDFKALLAEIGADFPPSLVQSLDRLILTLHPAVKNKNNRHIHESLEHPPRNAEDLRQRFPGLALKEKGPVWGAGGDAIDDEFALLEGLETKARQSRKRSRSPKNGHGAVDDAFALLEGLENKAKKSRRRSRNASPQGDTQRRRSRSPRTRRTARRSRSPTRVNGNEDGMGPAVKQKIRRANGGRYDDPYDDRHDGRRDSRNEDEYDEYGRYKRAKDRDAVDLDDAPKLKKVYDGRVAGITNFGAFVNIQGIRGKVDGLVHISRIVEGQRVGHPSDFLAQGQPVKVKVTSIEGNRIGLSMKEVDQQTGLDLIPQSRVQSGANLEALGSRNGNQASYQASYQADSMRKPGPPPPRQKKRMTSPERWEIRQLIASGVAKASDYPDLEEDYNATLRGEGEMELEEEVDIEVRDEEPPFLAGQTKLSLELSPIRVIKAPDGSLNRAAMEGPALTKERKALRAAQEAEAAAAEEEAVGNLTAQWHDPMADPDRRKFASDMRSARANQNSSTAADRRQLPRLQQQSLGKRTNLSIKEQRESLPVFAFRQQLIKAVHEYQILIVVGETGSGKTTQLTQYLAEAGFADHGIIGCTQPRRVAAVSVGKRVAEEVGCELGQEVGFTIRFEDRTSPATRIKYMTDGMLQREVLLDPDLKRYSAIMLDEAHERTIATDVLFALLKKAAKRRPDLKVIVTSATLDAEKFAAYFNECPIVKIPGRMYPVDILYSKEPESDYLDAALVTVMQIHLTEHAGDILVFLTGKDEIDTACEILHERMKALGPNVPELVILPIYANLPSEMQSEIFEPAPPGTRKVVIATNIAETSITIDDIYFVIDPGFVKQNAYDSKLGMDSLMVTPISQAQANQRAGRAGRTGPGKCFRLYTEAAFSSEMLPTTIPEIQRQNLATTILMLKAMGIDDLLNFDFMDPPPINTMLTALEELYALSALDDEGLLTRLGRKMADFPLDPSLSKAVIAAVDIGCSDELLSIVAMLNIQTVFHRPKEKQAQADQKKAKFHDPHGDHLTLLNVYNAWKNSGYSYPWCHENFIQGRSMKRARDVREQLVKIMERYRHPVISCGRATQKVRQALCSGFFRNAARKDQEGGYRTLIEGTPVFLHPSSALFGKQAEWVVYHTLVMTTKEYMQCTTSIEPKWLVEAAPTFFKVAPTDRLSKRKRAERIQPLYNRFQGEDDWRLSAQRRGRGGGGGGTWG